MPEVWNIFSIEPNHRGGGLGVMHPAIRGRHHASQPHFTQTHSAHPESGRENGRVNWPQQNPELIWLWGDRSSACDRPRTYDKFYQKTPGNFHDPTLNPSCSHETDSACISLCSSEEDRLEKASSPASASAVAPSTAPSQRKVKKTKKKRGELQYSRTITERDVKHLERHLSMKKTIRKKIMRDLQQAFVDDPSTFTRDEKTAADDKPGDIIEAFDFDPMSTKRARNENRFLEILRAGSSGSEDSGHGSPPPLVNASNVGGGSGGDGSDRQQKFRSVRERPIPRYPLLSDSSSCGGDDNSENNQAVEEMIVVASEQMKKLEVEERESTAAVASAGEGLNGAKPDASKKEKKKKSFWQKLLGGGKNKNKESIN
jgi:hypothetical protein